MTSGIQRPSGSGPAGPAGPSGPDDPTGADDVVGADAARGGAVEGRIAQLADAIQSGAMRAEDALAALVDDAVGPDLDPALAAELRELMQGLIANDPYLAGLARDVGAVPVDPGASTE